jgi:hypothetical protein
MASDDNKIKADPVQKNDAPPKTKSTADAAPSKAEGCEKDAGSSSGYHRGEGQKPVSKAYKDNWNLIFAKKKSVNWYEPFTIDAERRLRLPRANDTAGK